MSGPAEANAAIASDAAVSQETTLLDQRGSKALFGPTLLIPIDDSLLYVRALFVASSSNPVPQLQYVVVDYGGTVAIAPTLLGRTGALAKVIGSAVASVGSNEPTNIPTAIADDIKAADAADAQALQALKDDNFALFGKDLAEVRAELAAAKAGLAQLARQRQLEQGFWHDPFEHHHHDDHGRLVDHLDDEHHHCGRVAGLRAATTWGRPDLGRNGFLTLQPPAQVCTPTDSEVPS